MKIPIIILNYNSYNGCRKCINDLRQQEGVETEIIVVDNCSPKEGEQQAVQFLCEEQGCIFIQAHENRGYNAGNNIGLRYAAEQGHKYALIANPDMEFPQRDYLRKIIEKADSDNNIAILGTDIRTADGRCQNPLNFVSFWDELLWPIGIIKSKCSQKALLTVLDSNKSRYCPVISGCCLLVRIEFVRDIGFFDENVFLYCEEAILAHQVIQKGRKVFYDADAMALHQHIKSEKGNPYKRLITLCHSRNYKNKYHSDYNPIQIKLLYWSNCIQRFYLNLRMHL